MARALAAVISLVEEKTSSGVGQSWFLEPRSVVSGLSRQPIGAPRRSWFKSAKAIAS
jgi:hypothetical protein